MDLKTILIATLLRFPAIHFLMLGLKSQGLDSLGAALIALVVILLNDFAVDIARKV